MRYDLSLLHFGVYFFVFFLLFSYCVHDRGLSQDSIQEELEDEPLQFKRPMTRARSKRLEDQNYSRLLMLQAI